MKEFVMTIKWVEVIEENFIELEMIFELYNRVFPIEVREPQEIFLRSLQYAKERRPNNYHFIVGKKENQLVSFATGHYFADVNSGFIVYIVTNPLIQSKGIGSKTLEKLEDLLNKDAISAGNLSLSAIFLETETQEMVHTEEEKEDCIKRNRFFANNDYEKYEKIIYQQPSLHDEVGDLPLNLFIKNLDITKQSKEDIKKAIRTIYK
ncbi:GNAT family N-acetyltransferase [Bacillus sp. SM2101]|uniref:GNAT family N-acetyltransferase n=1 Tax=Bacillus sp. SM2101 TaxID=2805366 RepID=UPI0020323226|nr:GNAT family N-acetyltransferase [Bacillus sp. SM2101]